MNSIRNVPPILLLITLMGVGHARAGSPDLSRDFADESGDAPREFLKHVRPPVEEPPIPMDPAARLQADADREWTDWYHRAVVNRCWEEPAAGEWASFCTRVVPVALIQRERASAQALLDLRAECEQWINRDRDHPLTRYWLTTLGSLTNAPVTHANKHLGEAMKQAAFATSPPFLRLQITESWLRTQIALGKGTAQQRVDCLDRITDCLKDPETSTPADEAILVENTHRWIDDETFGEEEKFVLSWLKVETLSPWARDALTGHYHVQKAWESRGSGWADTVTEEGWEGFRKHLALAREHLVRAWQLRPEHVFAPLRMITVAKGECDREGETPRLWFDRAVTAQFDAYSAYTRYISSIRPRWGGSHQQVISFGKACAATQRYDTSVPVALSGAIIAVEQDLDDHWRDAWEMDSELPDLVMETDRQLLASAKSDFDLHWRRSELIHHGWIYRRFADADAELERLGNHFHPATLGAIHRHGVDPDQLRTEVACGARDLLDAWEAAEESYASEDLDGTLQRLGSLAEAFDGEKAPAFIRHRQAGVKVEQAARSHQWTPIPVPMDLSGWLVKAGEWSAEPGDILVHRGTTEECLALFAARIPDNFDLRFQCRVESPDDRGQGFGCVVGWHTSGSRARYLSPCWFYSQGQIHATVLNRQEYGSLDRVRLSPITNEFEVVVEVRNDRLTYRVNDQLIAENERLTVKNSPQSFLTVPPQSLIGFGHYRPKLGNIFRIHDIAIRFIEPSNDPFGR